MDLALVAVVFKPIFKFLQELQSMDLLVNKDYLVVVVVLVVVVGLVLFGQVMQILDLELGLLAQVVVAVAVEQGFP
jgi:hypothetical protein